MSPALLAAEAELPGWVLYAPLWFALAAGVFTFAVGFVFTTLALRKVPAPDVAPWYERARHVQSVRAVLTGLGVLPLVFALLTLGFRGELGRPGQPWSMVLAALTSLVAVSAVRVLANRRVFPERSAWRLWRDRATVIALIYPGLAVALLAAALMPAEIGLRDALWVAPVTAAILLLGTGAAIRVWIAVGLLRPASARVRDAVARASERTGIRPRRVCTVDLELANAFAFPIAQAVVVTRAAEGALADDELEAIAAHELGHLAEKAPVVALRLGLAPLLMCVVAFLRPLFHGVGAFGLLGIVLAALVAARLSVRLFRKMETRADAHSHQDGPALGRALEKVYAANLLPATTGTKRHVHPDLYDRMVEAGAPPAWPRPAPPPNARAAALVGPGFAFAAVFVFMQLHALPAGPEDVFAEELSVAASAGAPDDLAELGGAFREQGDWRRAELFLRAAAVPSARAGWRTRALLADVLARAGACESAATELAEARRLALDAKAHARSGTLEMAEATLAGCRPGPSNAPAP